jgi:hypothetical protein
MLQINKNKRDAPAAGASPASRDKELVLDAYETAVRSGASSSATFEAAVAAYVARHPGESQSVAYCVVASLLAEAEIGRLRHR